MCRSAVIWRSRSLASSSRMKSSTDDIASSTTSTGDSSGFGICSLGFIWRQTLRVGPACWHLVLSDVGRHHLFKGAGDVRDDRDHSGVFDPRWPEDTERSYGRAARDPVRCRYQRAVLKRWRAVLAADDDLHVAFRFFVPNDALIDDLHQT